MTHITLPRAVVEQVLAMLGTDDVDLDEFRETDLALRAALNEAKEVEPVAEIIGKDGGFVGDVLYGVKWLNSGSLPIGAKLYLEPQLFENSEQVQEPVAWPDGWDSDDVASWLKDRSQVFDPYIQGPLMRRLACFIEDTPLYTHPTPAVPVVSKEVEPVRELLISAAALAVASERQGKYEGAAWVADAILKDTHPEPAVPEGWQLVPKSINVAMFNAARECFGSDDQSWAMQLKAAYKAMLAVAPEPKP